LHKALQSFSKGSDHRSPMLSIGNRGTPCCCVKGAPEELAADTKFYCSPQWVKNSILLCGRKRSMFPFHCLLGPHWPVFLTTLGQIIGFSLMFIFLISEYLPTGFTLVTVISLLLVLVTLFSTALSDPGIVFKDSFNQVQQIQETAAAAEDGRAVEVTLLMECSQCNIMRPQTARHCSFCNVCVNKLDHHCPFMGKCIGEKNIYQFYAFVFFLYLHGAYLMFTTAYYVIWFVIIPRSK
jgi:hypothetical protein